MDQRFLRSQETSSYLHCACAQDQCSRHSARIGESTCCDDGHGYRIDNLYQECHETHHLMFSQICIEDAAVAARFHALGNNDIGSCHFSGPGFDNRRRGGQS